MLSDAKVDGDGFGVPDVQIAVRLGGEAGVYTVVAPACQVLGNGLSDKVGGGRGFALAHLPPLSLWLERRFAQRLARKKPVSSLTSSAPIPPSLPGWQGFEPRSDDPAGRRSF